jgi:hypothetical protein
MHLHLFDEAFGQRKRLIIMHNLELVFQPLNLSDQPTRKIYFLPAKGQT